MKPCLIKLQNFKAIGAEEQNIELAPITLLFGPNSAGKSTVLQSLIYLKEVFNHRNYDPDKTTLGGGWLDLGGFENLVHGHNLDKPIRIGMTLSLSAEDLPEYLSDHERDSLDNYGLPAVVDFFDDLETADIEISLRWSHIQHRPVMEGFECRLNNQPVATLSASLDGKQITIDSLPLAYSGLQVSIDSLPDEQSLMTTLTGLLDSSVIARGQIGVSEMMSESRPFMQQSIDELEQLLNQETPPPKAVLEKILEELEHRSTRKAYTLKTGVQELLDQKDHETVLEYLGLPFQTDALPDSEKGLLLDEDCWTPVVDSKDIDLENRKNLRLLTMAVVNTAICGPLFCLQRWLDQMSYLGPLRDLPPRVIQARKTPDKARWAKGLAAWELLPSAKPSLIDEINFWLSEKCLDSGYQVQVKHYSELGDDHSLYQLLDGELDMDQQLLIKELFSELPKKTRVCLLEEETDLEVMPQDVGVGISQLFPVVVLSIVQMNGLVAIEQPELHIHPKLQVELADIFIRYAIKNNIMFLLETHSEHLMLRLLRRVREASEGNSSENTSVLKPEDLAVQYVESSESGTIFKHLRVSEDGEFLDRWPRGFFVERRQELM